MSKIDAAYLSNCKVVLKPFDKSNINYVKCEHDKFRSTNYETKLFKKNMRVLTSVLTLKYGDDLGKFFEASADR